jgi:threonine synthase
MDVGDPSNWVRIRQLFENNLESLRSSVLAESITDRETLSTIEHVYKQHHYTLDPHGAVGYAALSHYLENVEDQKGYFLETAHPIKFYETIEPAIGSSIDKSIVHSLLTKKKTSIKISPDYTQLKDFLLANAR